MQEGLTHLRATRDPFYETRLVPAPVYTFKHVLTQTAAYQTLLPRVRRALHEQIAQILEAHFPRPARRNLNCSPLTTRRRACRRTRCHTGSAPGSRRCRLGQPGGSATPDHRAWRCWPRSPRPRRGPSRDLDLQLALGPASVGQRAMAARKWSRAYARARTLCGQVGETPQVFLGTAGVCDCVRRTRGELPTAREFEEQCLTLARREAGAGASLEAHIRSRDRLLLRREPSRELGTHFEQGDTLITDPMVQRDPEKPGRGG